MDERASIEEQVEWNFAALLNNELAMLRNSANRAFVRGDINRAVKSLIAMRQTGGYVFNKDERAKLDEIEKQFGEHLIKLVGGNSFDAERIKESNIAYQILNNLYKRYNELLTDFLDSYGFMGGRKKDASKMAIRKNS